MVYVESLYNLRCTFFCTGFPTLDAKPYKLYADVPIFSILQVSSLENTSNRCVDGSEKAFIGVVKHSVLGYLSLKKH